MHDPWIDRLSEFVDGALDAAETTALEQHLAGCAECRDIVAELRAVVAAAQDAGDSEPPRDLWSGIHTAITGSAAVTPLPQRTVRRFSFSMPQLAAAALVIMSLSGGAVWLASRTSAPDLASGTIVQSSGSARQVATQPLVEPEYPADIEGLERALEQNRAQLDPATVEVIERSLEAIDRAIDDARAALDNDPGNPYLHRQLDNTMRKKVDILRRATRAS
jgi:anti-sigma factor RsiW